MRSLSDFGFAQIGIRELAAQRHNTAAPKDFDIDMYFYIDFVISSGLNALTRRVGG